MSNKKNQMYFRNHRPGEMSPMDGFLLEPRESLIYKRLSFFVKNY